MTETYNHPNYMEHAASMLKDIGHSRNHKAYAESTTLGLFEGVLENLTSLYYPCLVIVDDMASRLTDHKSDNLLDQPYYQFAVLVKADIMDSASHRRGREKAKLIAKKVLSRMFRHQRARQHGLTYLQRHGIAFDGIGPIADGAYGCLVTFTLEEPAGITFNPNDWMDG